MFSGLCISSNFASDFLGAFRALSALLSLGVNESGSGSLALFTFGALGVSFAPTVAGLLWRLWTGLLDKALFGLLS